MIPDISLMLIMQRLPALRWAAMIRVMCLVKALCVQSQSPGCSFQAGGKMGNGKAGAVCLCRSYGHVDADLAC